MPTTSAQRSAAAGAGAADAAAVPPRTPATRSERSSTTRRMTDFLPRRSDAHPGRPSRSPTTLPILPLRPQSNGGAWDVHVGSDGPPREAMTEAPEPIRVLVADDTAH